MFGNILSAYKANKLANDRWPRKSCYETKSLCVQRVLDRLTSVYYKSQSYSLSNIYVKYKEFRL